MPLGTIVPKTYGPALDVRDLVLEPLVAYQRLTKLPAGWRRCRIAVVASIVGVSAIDMPISEWINANGVDALRPIIGLSNGNGLPCTPGVRFVGMSLGPSDFANWGIVATGGTCYLSSSGTNFWGAPILWNNGSRAWNTGFPLASSHTPMALTRDSFALMCDITASVDGSLTVGGAGIGNCNASEAQLVLAKALAASNTGALTITGWWSSQYPETGCQYLFIRLPCMMNRLRIHALRVMQFA